MTYSESSTKVCSMCKEEKNLSDFYADNSRKDKCQYGCKKCYSILCRENYKKESGLTSSIYSGQKRRSKLRNQNPPEYTKKELVDWLYLNGFYAMWCQWHWSGCDKFFAPSCDRINDYKSYSFDNIVLVTWKENNSKACYQKTQGLSTCGQQCKRVSQFSLSGEFIKSFASMAIAGKEMNIDSSNISRCCNNITKTCGGFKWEFA